MAGPTPEVELFNPENICDTKQMAVEQPETCGRLLTSRW